MLGVVRTHLCLPGTQGHSARLTAHIEFVAALHSTQCSVHSLFTIHPSICPSPNPPNLPSFLSSFQENVLCWPWEDKLHPYKSFTLIKMGSEQIKKEILYSHCTALKGKGLSRRGRSPLRGSLGSKNHRGMKSCSDSGVDT